MFRWWFGGFGVFCLNLGFVDLVGVVGLYWWREIRGLVVSGIFLAGVVFQDLLIFDLILFVINCVGLGSLVFWWF